MPREIFGMVFPVERWVAQADAGTLASYMTSGSDGLGDCYWLEGLVRTIEALGIVQWEQLC